MGPNEPLMMPRLKKEKKLEITRIELIVGNSIVDALVGFLRES